MISNRRRRRRQKEDNDEKDTCDTNSTIINNTDNIDKEWDIDSNENGNVSINYNNDTFAVFQKIEMEAIIITVQYQQQYCNHNKSSRR